ncbi:hypothetical protein J6590_104001 [Homalodisca vitripennis]|nr:hypothetical protein J6590_104001 [Homalodisca vitripennis]
MSVCSAISATCGIRKMSLPTSVGFIFTAFFKEGKFPALDRALLREVWIVAREVSREIEREYILELLISGVTSGTRATSRVDGSP